MIDGTAPSGVGRFRAGVPVWIPGPYRRAEFLGKRVRAVHPRGPGARGRREVYPSALSFQAKCGVTYPSAFEPSAELAERYRLVGLPTTVVIGPDGDPLYPPTCYLDLQALGKALDAVAGGNSGQVST